MNKGESIQEYFTRVSQFKEQLEAIGDKIDEDVLVMTTLNGLTRPWDAFIQTICARKEKLKCEDLWEECIQEEARVANREALLKENDQALAAHARKGKERLHFKRESHKEPHPPKKIQKYQKGSYKPKEFSSYQCYNSDKMGHIARNCLARKEEFKKKNNKRYYAYAAEEEEPPNRTTQEEIEEYVLFFALSESVTTGNDTWLIDSGA